VGELYQRSRVAEGAVEIRRSWRETCELNKEHPQAAEVCSIPKNCLPSMTSSRAVGLTRLRHNVLAFESYASDLNPVAVLINKAMIEIPPIRRTVASEPGSTRQP
jgi:putative DNA methylase